MKSKKLLNILCIIFILITVYFVSDSLSINKDVETDTYYMKEGKIYYKETWRIPLNDSELHYIMKPNHSQLFNWWNPDLADTIVVSINNKGFRDKNYNLSKDISTYRILNLGDSFAFGWGLLLNQTLSKQLETKLNLIESIKKYEVLNLGFPGTNFNEYVEIYKRIGLTYDHDLIIIQFIEDDFLNNFELGEYMKIEEKKNNNDFPLSSYFDAKNKYIKDFNKRPVSNQVFLVNTSMNKLKNLSKNKKVLFIIYPLFNSEQKHELKEIIKNYEWDYLDLETEINYSFDNPNLTLFSGDRHPSYLSNSLVSNLILDKINQVIS